MVVFNDSHTYFTEFVNVAPEIDKLDLRTIETVIYSPMNCFSVNERLGKIGDFLK